MTGGDDALGELIASTPLAVVEWDGDERIHRWSPQAEQMFGWRATEVLGRRLADLDLVHADDRRLVALAQCALIEGDRHDSVVEQRNLTRDRRQRTCRWHNGVVRTAGGAGLRVLSLIEDITERRASQQRIRALAEHDGLTRLPNRTLLVDRLTQAVARARRAQGRGALMLLDLDEFKDVNDTHGHPIGDRLLVETARRLLHSVRETDTVARFGGDEFALLLPEVESAEAAVLVAGKVLTTLAQPYRLDDGELESSSSVGVALFPDHGEDPEVLIEHADLALYQAKADGRATYTLFAPGLRDRADARLTTVQELREAVRVGAFELRFQPEVALGSGAITGIEALVRWRHPERGLLGPEAFLEAAETSGLIRPIGQIVLQLACAQLQAWRQAGLEPPPIALNLSPIECRQPTLAAQVEAVIARNRLAPRDLGFEIAETVVANDRRAIPLHQVAIGLTLDRFGADAASLKSLQRLPFRRVKLARQFVQASLADPSARLVCESLIQLAHRLGLIAIATGVETEAQRDALRTLGCDAAQGYLFAPPLTAEGLAALLAVRV